jgi:hypothetical protein
MPSDAIRLVKVPDAAPPYDCPVHGARCPERAADRAPGRASAGRASAGRALAGRALAGGHPSAVSRAAGTRDPGSRAPVAGPAAALALVIVETLAGVRPERQLIPLTTDRVRARIRSLGPLLRCDQRPRVLRIIASRPLPLVVEMTMVVTFGPRSRALALRFEQTAARPARPGGPARPARWLCTAIETG